MRFCSARCVQKSRIIDINKKTFGYWTVLNKPTKASRKGLLWYCRCKCGKERYVLGFDLRKGISTSCGCKNKLPYGESACRWIFSIYKKQALSRNHVFELTLDQFKIITKQNCLYCGSKPLNVCNREKYSCSNGNYIYNGIDRKNNNKGYTKENVVPCCKICNSMKSKLSGKEFFDHISKIYKKNSEDK